MRKDLARKHLDQRLSKWQPATEFVRPPRGWIKAIREAIGMTASQLAVRLNVSQSRVSALEKDETRDALTLETINRAAQAMDCTLVYALIPNTSLERFVTEQAKKKVAERLAQVDHTMKLEAQGLANGVDQAEYERIVSEILKSNLRGLWDPS